MSVEPTTSCKRSANKVGRRGCALILKEQGLLLKQQGLLLIYVFVFLANEQEQQQDTEVACECFPKKDGRYNGRSPEHERETGVGFDDIFWDQYQYQIQLSIIYSDMVSVICFPNLS